MNHLSTILISSLFIVACKSEKKDAPPPAPVAKPAETEPAETAAEAAKMNRDDDTEKEKLVEEAAAESAKDQAAKGIPTAEAVLKAIADGTFDYAMVDPSSTVAYADFAAKPAVERARCGASDELKATAPLLATAFKNTSVYCKQLPTKLVRCQVSLAAPSDASTEFDQLFFDFEIVMGDAHLRAFGKQHLAGTTEQREKMFAEHDAKIVALGKKRCADAHD